MSILIKGMEMPIDCFHCAFEYDNECVADNDNRTTNLNGRPEWCPLVELPPEENRLYICDPSKADGCSKTRCAYAGGAEHGDCMLTTRLEWALMEERQ